MIAPTMWIADSGRDYLDRVLQPDWHGAEFGSGGSTLWLAQRVAHLTSVEHKANWYKAVQAGLKELKLKNVKLHFVKDLEQYETPIYALADPVDFVFVDGKRRLACMLAGASKLRPGGMLIMDNTDERVYRDAAEFGNELGWVSLVFRGMGYNPKKKQPQALGDTTIWIKPEQ